MTRDDLLKKFPKDVLNKLFSEWSKIIWKEVGWVERLKYLYENATQVLATLGHPLRTVLANVRALTEKTLLTQKTALTEKNALARKKVLSRKVVVSRVWIFADMLRVLQLTRIVIHSLLMDV